MDEQHGFGGHPGFRVFISSTSADLGDTRAALADYLRRLGADVRVQVDHPDTLNDGFAIKAAIDAADLNICLVGHCFGGRLKGTPPGENIPADASWTQWELLYAVERYRREHGGNPPPRPRLLIYFAGDRLKRPAEPEAQQALQAAFREKLKRDLRNFGGAFSWTFDSEAWLLDHVRHTVEGSNGLVAAVLDGRWALFGQAYAEFCAASWTLDFPDGAVLSRHGADAATWFAEGSPLFARDGPLLIDTQRLALVTPRADGMQLDQVADPLALSGDEIGFDDLKAAFLGDSPAARDGLKPPRPAVPQALRLALVTNAGLGKTTTLRRLQHEINRSGKKLAVLLDAIDFRDTTDDRQNNLKLVVQQSIKGMGLDWTGFGLSRDAAERDRADAEERPLLSPVALISHGILEAAKAGRLVILIDGLDHVDTVPRALVHLQQDETWAATDVVVSGRPQPFSEWDETESLQGTPDARFWRFAVPREVTADEAKAYLGGIGPADSATWRYDLVSRNLGRLLFVPRVLAYVRTLGVEELTSARTSSDIYYAAVRYLLQHGLSSIAGKKAPADEVERFLGLISALAFESMFSGARGIRRDHAAPLPITFNGEADEANGGLVARTRRFYGGNGHGGRAPRATLGGDLERLARLSTLVSNGLLDNDRGIPERLESVLWVNPTLQHFLAAYWLSKWAPGDLASHAGGLDSDWFRAALFYPHASNSGATEELNRFLAEMPAACIGATSWLCAARAWYDPALVRGPGRPGLWSTEMIARSWRTMHTLADRPVDDWWDISYESLCAHPPGARPDLYAQASLRPNDPIVAAAGAVLDGFLGDFEAQLAASAPGSAARRFVGDNWLDVPAGALDPMGSPIEQQRVPPRILAVWKRQIRQAADAPDLAELARRSSPDSWWTGPYGRRQYEEEVAWLVDKVFGPYAEAARRGPSALAAAEEQVLAAMRDNFFRSDETPEEATQPVAAFTLNALPVTNEVFALFSPGHLCDIDPVVALNQESQRRDGKTDDSRGEYASSGWNAPDRPAVYVSWFDAWAFAQWARWRSDGIRHACRLPHEPEWEYACKRCEAMQDPSQRSLFGQLYWWGNDFYDRPEDPEEESKSTPEAHAVGWPGATRPPRLAAPNGFGFRDMIGNTWEWCANVYDLRSEAEIKQDRGTTRYSRHRPAGEPPRNNAPRSMRGGIWYYMNHIATASNRFRLEPADADYKTGFRLVRETMLDEMR